MKSRKIFGLVLALTVFAASSLWAQTAPTATAPSDILTSPQSTATEGRYRSTADNFIRTDTYGDVKFNKFFAYTSFVAANKGTFGYATKFGDTYVGLYYGGNFWSANTPFNYTETTRFFDNGVAKEFTNYTITGTGADLAFTATVPDNRVALLIGAADMGFRLSYATTHEAFKQSDMTVTDTTSTTTYYKNYEMELGYISPQIEWAMAKDLTEKNGIRPKINLTLNFIRSNRSKQLYDETDGSVEDRTVDYSANYLYPVLIFNPGGFHVYNQDGFRLTVDLDYELHMRVYEDNEYSHIDDTDATRTITGTIKGLNTGTALTQDMSYVQNRFIPSLAGSWSGGPLALRFKLNLQMNLANSGYTTMDWHSTAPNSLVKDGVESTVTAFDFQPNLRLAAQWKIVPDRFTLNAGARVNFGNITTTTTESSSYIDGVKSPYGSKSVTTAYTATANHLKLGVTLMPTSNLTFEATIGATTSSAAVNADNTIRVFDSTANGLFYFSSILASLRY